MVQIHQLRQVAGSFIWMLEQGLPEPELDPDPEHCPGGERAAVGAAQQQQQQRQ